MAKNELIEQWLWMQTMNYALGIVKRQYRSVLYPRDKEMEWRFEGWREMQRSIFTHALENWPPRITYSGASSGHSQYEIGHDLTAKPSGVTGEYKNITVEIKWTEVKRFIEKMLEPDMEDRQIDLLELLAKEAIL